MQNVTRLQFFALAAAAIITAATPRTAEAIPAKFRKCPRVVQNGITYRLFECTAIVEKCPARKSVTIPHSIRHAGKAYTVAAIWDGAISPKTARVVLKARELETIEDARIWRRNVTVICGDKSTRAWLKRGGAKVK